MIAERTSLKWPVTKLCYPFSFLGGGEEKRLCSEVSAGANVKPLFLQ